MPTTAETPGAAPQPRGCTNFKLRQLVRRVTQHYDQALAGVGLKVTQYSLLTHVHRQGPVQPVALAQAMTLSASTLSRNLQPLIAAGWIAVQPGADARSRLLVITEAGRAKRLDAQRRWRNAQEALNARLGVARVVALHAMIDEAMARLDPAHEEGDLEIAP
jgi:DNA-binding MarR family transcriptional regulator